MMAMAYGHLPAVIPYFRSALKDRELRAQTDNGGGLRSKISDIKTGIEDARLRQWALASRLPPSVPIAWKPILSSYPEGLQLDSSNMETDVESIAYKPSCTSTTTTTAKASFISLPLELRLKIYDLVLGPEPEILQPSGCCTYHGSFPPTWPRWQRTRTDDDPPSPTLCRTIGLGGTSFQQRVSLPPRRSLRYGAVAWMLLGGGDDYEQPTTVGTRTITKTTTTHITDLMRTCRPVYRDLLDRLYADNTISLFGPDMLRFFLGNVSPEGLQRVRYVHLALPVPAGLSSSSSSSRYKDEVERAVAAMGKAMTGLRELDLEVAVLWEQPPAVSGGVGKGHDERGFWEWLTRDVVLGGLLLKGEGEGEEAEAEAAARPNDDNNSNNNNLDKFVMKVSVYQRQHHQQQRRQNPSLSSSREAKRLRRSVDEWIPATVPLATFNQGEYVALQEMVTGRRRKGDWSVLSVLPGGGGGRSGSETTISAAASAAFVSPSPLYASTTSSRGRSWKEIVLM